MKKIISTTFIVLASLLQISAAEKPDSIVFHNLEGFPVLGLAVPDAPRENLYDRLPAALKDSIREELWNLGKNTAGVAVLFRSDAKTLKVRWDVLNNFWMGHMTPVGIKGLDVYGYDDGRWVFMGSGRPGHQKNTFTSTIISNMDGSMREYMVFLPLYDGAVKVEVGVNEGAVVEQPATEIISRDLPVVVYGTSVTQGGCATRPGMAYTSILMRRLNKEFINLGFSGNGRLDLEIARVMADTPASLFILDNMANCNLQHLDNLEAFIKVLREKQPDTPILLMSNARHTYERFDLKTQADLKEKNAKLIDIYNRLKVNDSNLYYADEAPMIGDDEEGTVDGAHLTDLGFLRMADALQPIIAPLIDKQ